MEFCDNLFIMSDQSRRSVMKKIAMHGFGRIGRSALRVDLKEGLPKRSNSSGLI
jgi:hypothetical protein